MENIKATQITAGMTITYAEETAKVVEVKKDNSGFGFDLVMDNGESWFIFKGMEVELVATTAEVSANDLECPCGQRHSLMAGQAIAACKCGATYKIPAVGYNETVALEPMAELELRLHNQAIWKAMGTVSVLTRTNDSRILELQS